jgi:hypothetical protein
MQARPQQAPQVQRGSWARARPARAHARRRSSHWGIPADDAASEQIPRSPARVARAQLRLAHVRLAHVRLAHVRLAQARLAQARLARRHDFRAQQPVERERRLPRSRPSSAHERRQPEPCSAPARTRSGTRNTVRPLASLAGTCFSQLRHLDRGTVIGSSVDGVDRSGKRLRIRLHFSGKRAHTHGARRACPSRKNSLRADRSRNTDTR